MINRHGSINLCLGSVNLPGLVDADVICKMDMHADEDGKHRTISRTVWEIMMGTKHSGMRLWQMIMIIETDVYEGYFPQGKNCNGQKSEQWIGSANLPAI